MDRALLLEVQVQEFIRRNESEDLNALLLKHGKNSNLPIKDIVVQIKSRKKAASKLPTWYNTNGILYPAPVSIEQASSEITARYKTSKFSGAKALDLTGGFGVDSFYLAKNFDKLTYLEPNEVLAEIATHNFAALGAANVEVHRVGAEEFIKSNNECFDLVYIDPDRRPEAKRVISFSDSRPDLPDLLPDLAKITSQVMVKASPMMDIDTSLKELQHVSTVTVLAVDNEVKELLFTIDFSNRASTLIRAVNIRSNNEEILDFYLSEESQEVCTVVDIQKYLFEPNAAILKAGAFNIVGIRYGLGKLNTHTHLYTAQQPIADFPGRVFKVIANCNYRKKDIIAHLHDGRANLSTRNFVDSPQQIKQKLGTKDGGELYLFGYKNFEGKNKVAICEKIQMSKLRSKLTI